MILDGKFVVLGVTGGIAAYKSAIVASLLVQSGAHVEVVLTESAQRFIQPMTFSAITHAPVHTDPFAPWQGKSGGHVSLADSSDLLIVAPATAAAIARLALGLSDDLIGLVALSTRAPLLIAPAMEDGMYSHPATQQHLAALTERGATIVGPEHGRLASGAVGRGRMSAPEQIVDAARLLLGRSGPLASKKVVVTAGGTREPLDPVRFIGNRSSGRMGYALAEAALAVGASVTLISGPVDISPPVGIAVIPIETALEMQRAVDDAVKDADILIMAAAVADFRPESTSNQKIKKEKGREFLDLRLIRNPDILAAIDRPHLLKVGFAAETENLIENAQRKLAQKGLDLIIANDAAVTIGAIDSEAVLLTAEGQVTALPRISKEALATEILRVVARLLLEAERHDT